MAPLMAGAPRYVVGSNPTRTTVVPDLSRHPKEGHYRMKRVFNLVAAAFLAAGLGVAVVQPAQAATIVPAGSIVTPDGKVVQKLASPAGVRLSKAGHVLKGLPSTTAVKSTPTTSLLAAGCDGVTTGTNVDGCFLYNVGSQGDVNKAGVWANNRVGGHTGALSTVADSHTLGEVAVQSPDGRQTIEVGWTVDPVVNKTAGVGTMTPRAFVFYWVNGVPQSYNGGAFVPVSGATVVPGVTNLTSGDLAKNLIWHDAGQHVWWIGYGTEFIGYFPDSAWASATTATGAAYVFDHFETTQLFGEIASSVSKPCSDMGLGVLPTDTTNSARFSSTSFLNVDYTGDSTSVNLYVHNSARNAPYANSGSPYAGTVAATARSFYYGGPMWNSAKTGAGTKGAC
jgi:hypothetical protein